MARLQIRQGGEVVRSLPLEMKHLSIGRTPDNGLPLKDKSVAIRHAEISIENDVLLLTALAADQFVTFVNGHMLPRYQPRRLEHGDELQIGAFVLTVLTEEQATLTPIAEPSSVRHSGQLQAYPAKPPLPLYPVPLPPSQAAAMYESFLPPLFQESDFLRRFLKIFQVVWEPLQGRQDHLHLYFDPSTCPPAVLNWLAQCLGVPLNPEWPEGRQRAWMREAVMLYRWRGTRYGLARSLETVFGVSPELVEDAGKPYTFTIRLLDSLDGEATADREAVKSFILQQIPAHTRVEIEFVGPESERAEPRPRPSRKRGTAGAAS